LEKIGYTSGSLYSVVLGATWFARHLVKTGKTDLWALRDRHIADFVATLPVYHWRGREMKSMLGIRSANHVLRYLRTIGVTPPEPQSERALMGAR
jgi:hypothetical protein